MQGKVPTVLHIISVAQYVHILSLHAKVDGTLFHQQVAVMI